MIRSGITDKKRVYSAKSRAKQFMLSGGNYMTLVFAVVLCVPPLVLSYFLASLISQYTLPWVPFAVLAIMAATLFAPMALGAVRVAVSLYCGGENPLAEMFFAFSSYGVYFKTLFLALVQAVKLALAYLPPFLVFMLTGSLVYKLFPAYSIVATAVATVLAIVTFVAMDFVLSWFNGVMFYSFADGDVDVIGGIRLSVKNREWSLWGAVSMKLRSVVLIVISIIPLFLPFFLYTAPYLLCRYVYTMARQRDIAVLAEPCVPQTSTKEIIETGDINNE